jgi:5-(carboxyamino)imidazole ribonucleotide synthase
MLIAVVGGGQLGRMLGLAALPLGFHVRFLDPGDDCPASVVGEVVCGAFDDPASLDRLVVGAACATYEFENVPAASARRLEAHTRLAPSSRSLDIAQDRISEKTFFASCGVPVQRFHAVSTSEDLRAAVATVGVPALLKTRRLGYDGKGQVVVRSAEAAALAWESLGRVPCIYEAFVPFVREVSVVATRGPRGTFTAHPLVRNEHREGILRVSVAPDPDASDALRRTAEAHVRRIAESLDHVGTLAVEFFVVREDDADGEERLVANEMAPRVHNSGHWTIEGAVTSQFENHIRAVVGLPLGDAGMRGGHAAAAMVNLIGTVPPIEDILAIPGAKLHLYGKSPKPGRKLGHITVTAPDHDELAPLVDRLRELVREPDPSRSRQGAASGQ